MQGITLDFDPEALLWDDLDAEVLFQDFLDHPPPGVKSQQPQLADSAGARLREPSGGAEAAPQAALGSWPCDAAPAIAPAAWTISAARDEAGPLDDHAAAGSARSEPQLSPWQGPQLHAQRQQTCALQAPVYGGAQVLQVSPANGTSSSTLLQQGHAPGLQAGQQQIPQQQQQQDVWQQQQQQQDVWQQQQDAWQQQQQQQDAWPQQDVWPHQQHHAWQQQQLLPHTWQPLAEPSAAAEAQSELCDAQRDPPAHTASRRKQSKAGKGTAATMPRPPAPLIFRFRGPAPVAAEATAAPAAAGRQSSRAARRCAVATAAPAPGAPAAAAQRQPAPPPQQIPRGGTGTVAAAGVQTLGPSGEASRHDGAHSPPKLGGRVQEQRLMEQLCAKLALLTSLQDENTALKSKAAVLESFIATAEHHVDMLELGTPKYDRPVNPSGPDSRLPMVPHNGSAATSIDPCPRSGAAAAGAVEHHVAGAVHTASAAAEPLRPGSTVFDAVTPAGGSSEDVLRAASSPPPADSPAAGQVKANGSSRGGNSSCGDATVLSQGMQQVAGGVPGDLLPRTQGGSGSSPERGAVCIPSNSAATPAAPGSSAPAGWSTASDAATQLTPQHMQNLTLEDVIARWRSFVQGIGLELQREIQEFSISTPSAGGSALPLPPRGASYALEAVGNSQVEVVSDPSAQNLGPLFVGAADAADMANPSLDALVKSNAVYAKMLAFYNPGLNYQLLSVNMADKAVQEAPGMQHWRRVISKLAFTPDQMKMLLASGGVYQQRLVKLLQERAVLQQQLAQVAASSAPSGVGSAISSSSSSGLPAAAVSSELWGLDATAGQQVLLSQLHRNLREEHMLRQDCNCSLFGKVMTSYQYAMMAYCSWPWMIDSHALIVTLLQDAGRLLEPALLLGALAAATPGG